MPRTERVLKRYVVHATAPADDLDVLLRCRLCGSHCGSLIPALAHAAKQNAKGLAKQGATRWYRSFARCS